MRPTQLVQDALVDTLLQMEVGLEVHVQPPLVGLQVRDRLGVQLVLVEVEGVELALAVEVVPVATLLLDDAVQLLAVDLVDADAPSVEFQTDGLVDLLVQQKMRVGVRRRELAEVKVGLHLP